MSEREYTVTTRDESTGAFREEWLGGKSGSTAYMIDLGVGSPTLTLNVLHGDHVVRESVDLTPLLTRWVNDIVKELKKQ